MVNTRELRLGNYIQTVDHTGYNRIGTVTKIILPGPDDPVGDLACIYTDHVLDRIENPSEVGLLPIKINDAWLIKMGFVVEKQTFDGFEKWESPLLKLIDRKIPDSKISIIYVHQLQNLYFALTGKELIIE